MEDSRLCTYMEDEHNKEFRELKEEVHRLRMVANDAIQYLKCCDLETASALEYSIAHWHHYEDREMV